MAKTTSSKQEFFDMSKAFGALSFPNFSVEAFFEAQQRNLDALTQANRVAVETMQAVTRRQTENVQRALEEVYGLLREWSQPSAPEERLSKSAETARQAFESGVANVRELNELTTKAGAEVFNLITKRLSESFDEVGSYAKRQAAAE
jgi:phasin family protein